MRYRYSYNGKVWYFEQQEKLELRQYQIEWQDYIPSFDNVLAAANKYGALDTMKILGVELMNSDCSVSIDDLVAKHSYTYIAHGLRPWI